MRTEAKTGAKIEPQHNSVARPPHVQSRPVPPIHYTTRFPALDGIRAIAVSLVFLSHYGGGAHSGRIIGLFNSIHLRGWVGVDLFFVLSGFLITGVLYDTREDPHYFSRFMGRRALRIFPVLYLSALVLAALTPVFNYEWRPSQLTFLIYLGNLPAIFDSDVYKVYAAGHPAARLYLGHLWSLCVEEQFYLIWPAVVWLVRDRIKLLWITGLLSCVSLGLRIHTVFAPPTRASVEGLFHTLPFRMDVLLAGAALALLLRGPAASRWQRRMIPALAIAAPVTALLLLHSADGTTPWTGTVGIAMLALTGAALVGTALQPASAIYGVLNLRPLTALGRYSYGFYVYHLFWAVAWAAFARYLAQRIHNGGMAGAIEFTLNFTVTFLVAKLSYETIESRFLRLKSHFAYDREAACISGPGQPATTSRKAVQ